MVEAHRAAQELRGRAAAAVAEDLVALGDQLALEVEDAGRGGARLVAQHVPAAVGDEREVAREHPVRPVVRPRAGSGRP